MRSRRAVLAVVSAAFTGCIGETEDTDETSPTPTATPTETLYFGPDDDVPDLIVRNFRSETVTVVIELFPEDHETPAEVLSWELEPSERVVVDTLPAIRDGGEVRVTVGDRTETVEVPRLNDNRNVDVRVIDEGLSASYRVM